MAAHIEISGEIATQEVLDGLIKAAIADDVIDWSDRVAEDEHAWIEAEFRSAARDGRPVGFDGPGSSIFENVTGICEEHGLSYVRTADADEQFSAEIVTFDGATNAKEEYEMGHNDRVVVGLDTLTAITDMAALADLIETMQAAEKKPEPIVIALSPAPAAA